MLDFLSRADQGGVHDGLFGLRHDLLALLEQAFHARTLLALDLDAELLADLFKALRMPAGLVEVILKGLAQLLSGGRFGHSGKRLDDLVLGAVQIFDLVLKQGF